MYKNQIMHKNIKPTERLNASGWSLFDQVECCQYISACYRSEVRRKRKEYQLRIRVIFNKDIESVRHLHQEYAHVEQKISFKLIA